jgi:hypothetical protein
MSSLLSYSLLLLGLAPLSALAIDSVGITRDPGYPPPGSNDVATRLVIARESDAPAEQATITDVFFDSVRKILVGAPVPTHCCTRATDLPFVEIDISLGGQTYELTMTSTGTRLQLPLDPTPDQRLVAEVMERILKLSEEWKEKSPH